MVWTKSWNDNIVNIEEGHVQDWEWGQRWGLGERIRH